MRKEINFCSDAFIGRWVAKKLSSTELSHLEKFLAVRPEESARFDELAELWRRTRAGGGIGELPKKQRWEQLVQKIGKPFLHNLKTSPGS